MIIDYKNIGIIKSLLSDKSWDSSRMELEVGNRVQVLLENNITNKDKIIIFHGGEPEFFADLFAIWEIGACAICLNPKTTMNELENIYDFVNPSMILLLNNNLTNFNKSCIILNLSNEKNKSPRSYEISHDENSDALILFTSGTTGTPKGVVHTYKSLSSRLKYNLEYIPISDLTNTLCLLPMHFGHGLIGNCLTPIAAGQNLFIISGSDIKNIATIGSVIDNNKITFMSSVPSLWKLIFKISKTPKDNTLKRIHVGSAPLSEKVWTDIAKWSSAKSIVNMYGITETANWIAGASSEQFTPENGLIGKMWGGKAYIMDETGKIKSSGTGVILLDTPSLMKGYYQLKEVTDIAISDGLFNTGDIGTIDELGVIRITGREKFEINRAGMKINPEDLDMLLENHEAIDEACAFAIPDDMFGEVAGVAIKLNSDITIKDLKSWCADKIIVEKIPAKWYIVDTIPKNDRGKVDRLSISKKYIDKR
jgi:oxalate---CoA ligase